LKKICIKCSNELIKAYVKGLQGELGVSKKSSGIFIGFSYSEVSPYVCSNCGYIEFFLEGKELDKFKIEK
jgi:hypothetical protein